MIRVTFGRCDLCTCAEPRAVAVLRVRSPMHTRCLTTACSERCVCKCARRSLRPLTNVYICLESLLSLSSLSTEAEPTQTIVLIRFGDAVLHSPYNQSLHSSPTATVLTRAQFTVDSLSHVCFGLQIRRSNLVAVRLSIVFG
jgi:hypothetical protein